MKIVILLLFMIFNPHKSVADYTKYDRSLDEIIPTLVEFHQVEARFVSCAKVINFIRELNSQLSDSRQLHVNCKNIQNITRVWSHVDIIRSKTILSSPTKLCTDPLAIEDEPDKYFNIFVDQVITDNTYNRVGEFILEDFGIETLYENDNPSYAIIGLKFPICD